MMKHLLCSTLVLLATFLSKAQTTNSIIDSALTEKPLQSSVISETNTISSFNGVPHSNFLKKNGQYLLPAAMFGYGVLASTNSALKSFDLKIRSEVLAQPNRNINRKIEDVLQYVPVYSVFALNAVGLKGENKFIDRLALYAVSNTIMSQTVVKMKKSIGKLRPDGSNRRSFPSGHTATAFSAAEFMRLEYKDASPIYGIAAYTVAAATGALRIYHNNHWFSDVIAGAGIGILSTDLTYFVYPKVKNFITRQIGFKPKNLHVGPTYQSGTAGLAIVYNPK